MKRWLLPLSLLLAVAPLAPYPQAGAAPDPTEPQRELQERLERAEMLAGLTPVSGPGLIITLRHSSAAVPAGADPKSVMIRERDVSALLAALRAAGAEALAVGGRDERSLQRVLVRTAIVEKGDGLAVNGVQLLPPYRVLAIGSARMLREELFREQGVVKSSALDVLKMIETSTARSLELPGATSVEGFRYARATFTGTPAPRVAAATPTRVASAAPTVPSPAAPTVPAAVRPAPGPVEPPIRAAAPAPTTPKDVTASARPQANDSASMASSEGGRRSSTPVVTSKSSPVVAPETESVTPKAAPPVTPKSAPPTPPKVARAVSPKTPEPAAAPAAPAGAVFGGKGLAKYHVAGCRFGERIEADARVSFSSAADATRAGRAACPVCCVR